MRYELRADGSPHFTPVLGAFRELHRQQAKIKTTWIIISYLKKKAWCNRSVKDAFLSTHPSRRACCSLSLCLSL